MKKVRDIPFFKNIREVREYQFGRFYFFDGIVIAEINKGVIYGWDMAQRAIDAAIALFGNDKPIAFISNRIHEYSVLPADWSKFYKNRRQLDFYCVVGQAKSCFPCLVLKKMFHKHPIHQFADLEHAISWTLSKFEEKKEG